jgi:hypothetical protein
VGGATAPGNCCEETTGVPGCTDEAIRACVCAQDEFCCTAEWDAQCVVSVGVYGCGPACAGTCTEDKDCVDPQKPICNAGICSGSCTKDDDCDFQVCNVASGKCVDCNTSADCSGTLSVCNTELNLCLGCEVDDDCKGAPGKPYCDAQSGACISCKSDGDCKTPEAPFCEVGGGECIACKIDGDCKDPNKPFCDGGGCVGCRNSNDCKDPAKPTCDSQGQCAGKGPCCADSGGVPGCIDAAVEACVCAQDSYCCEEDWDEQCIAQIAEFKCGTCP